MKRTPPNLGSTGDPQSEIEIMRRFQWLKAQGEAPVFFTQADVDRDPAVKKAVRELRWIRVRG